LPTSDTATLCSNLATGLHAAAQPLAILRASFGHEEIESMSWSELKELATSSAIHVERVCTLYTCIEQLVSTESIKPQLTPMHIKPVLEDVVDGVCLLFQDRGMTLNLRVSDQCEPVLISRVRTVQALSSALMIAQTVCKAPDTIDLIASPSSTNGVRVELRSCDSDVEALDAETKLRMDIAETNIRSQGASFSWRLHPFAVQMELRKAPGGHSFR
jgi:hypothetical protein